MASNDSTKKILTVALGVCLVCSVLVSASAVSLRSRQERNKELDKIKNILTAGALPVKGADVFQVFRENIQTIVVDIESGRVLDLGELPAGFDPAKFNIKEAADSRDFGKALPPEKDLIGMQRIPRFIPVYEVISGGRVSKLILPIYGKGLWSTLYGFLALNADLTTVEGITFYEHGETPGLGGEVDNPNWKAKWHGKRAFDDQGHLKLQVLKGAPDPNDPEAIYQIDGLSGATLTTRGLDAMVRFWLGEDGYGRFLARLKEDARHEG